MVFIPSVFTNKTRAPLRGALVNDTDCATTDNVTILASPIALELEDYSSAIAIILHNQMKSYIAVAARRRSAASRLFSRMVRASSSVKDHQECTKS